MKKQDVLTKKKGHLFGCKERFRGDAFVKRERRNRAVEMKGKLLCELRPE